MVNGGSLPGSRRGSFSGPSGWRSSSALGGGGGGRMDRYWQQAVDGGGEFGGSRPPSRTDHDARRWQSVGKLDTSEWEEKIRYGYACDSHYKWTGE